MPGHETFSTAGVGARDPRVTLSHEVSCVLDAERRFSEVNPAWEKHLGWSARELIGRRVEDLVHPEDRARTIEILQKLRAGAEIDSFENRCRSRDGSYRWLSWDACIGRDGLIYAVGRDISGSPPHALTLPLTEAFFRHLVEHSGDAIITKNTDAVITSWNQAATLMYGYTAEEAIGRPVSIIVPPERQGEEFEVLDAVLRNDRVERYETERVTKDGRRLQVALSVSAIRDKYGDVVGAAAIARDITERKRMERELTYLAHHDALTGIYNRARFHEELAQWLRYARRYRRSGALLIVDLDNFKLVNDTYGHAAGDLLLQRVARQLSKHVREADVVGRMGGDEFAVLLTEVDGTEAVQVAGKLLRHLRVSVSAGDRRVSASVGVAAFDGQARCSVSELMSAADAALYEAKAAGRNRVAARPGAPVAAAAAAL